MPVSMIAALLTTGALALPPTLPAGTLCEPYGAGDPRPACQSVQNDFHALQRYRYEHPTMPADQRVTNQFKINQLYSQAHQIH